MYFDIIPLELRLVLAQAKSYLSPSFIHLLLCIAQYFPTFMSRQHEIISAP